ncbi:hypothetical protein AAHB57_29535 [Bacillus cereus]
MKKYYEGHEDWYENKTEAVKQRYEWLEETCRLEMKSFKELQYKRITGTDGEKDSLMTLVIILNIMV